MAKKAEDASAVDQYIAGFPPEVRALLSRVRATIREAAPLAAESIAYGMPAYSQDGPVVYFAAHKGHLGLYPLPEALEEFRERLAPYGTSKGSIRFPFGEELPLDLIRDIVRSRVESNARKASLKAAAKRRS